MSPLPRHARVPPSPPPPSQGSAFRAVGAPTEAALLVLAEKLGVADPAGEGAGAGGSPATGGGGPGGGEQRLTRL